MIDIFDIMVMNYGALLYFLTLIFIYVLFCFDGWLFAGGRRPEAICIARSDGDGFTEQTLVS
jgi:hypothetical protein